MGNSEYFGPKQFTLTHPSGAPITTSAPLIVETRTIDPSTFPDKFKQYTEILILSEEAKLLNPGGKNTVKLWPRVLSEHQEEAADVVGIVTKTSGLLGMTFKASTPANTSVGEIHGVSLILDVDGGGGITENFPYNTQADLDAVWITDDPSNTPITIDTSKFVDSPASLLITVNGKNSEYDEVYQVFPSPQNWSNITDISFGTSASEDDISIEIFFSDGSNRKIYELDDMTSSFKLHTIPLASFNREGDEEVDLTSVVEWGIKIASHANGQIWVDSIAANSRAGYGDISLYHLGSSIPVTGSSIGSLIRRETIPLKNGVKVIHEMTTNLAKGWPIIDGDFYAITLSNCDANVRGHNGSFYSNGYGFLSSDNSTITSVPGFELAFEVFVRVPAVAKVLNVSFNGITSNGKMRLFIEHKPTEKITKMIAQDIRLYGRTSFESYFKDQQLDLIQKDHYLEVAAHIDSKTRARRIALTAIIYYEPFIIHG